MGGKTCKSMRERLLEELDSVPHRRFLVYVMGPYKMFHVEDLLDGSNADDVAVDFGGESDDDVLDLLVRVRNRLRIEPGVNAFIALDADIDVDEMDPATQSIEFARASNAVVFVAPRVGKNLGVGIETGSVLEDVYNVDENDEDEGHRQERILFVHEENVRSAMISSISRRWDATIRTYGDEDELLKRVRQFAADVMNKELTGDLPSLDE